MRKYLIRSFFPVFPSLLFGSRCLEYEKSEKELNEKVTFLCSSAHYRHAYSKPVLKSARIFLSLSQLSCLMNELEEAKAEHARLLDEAKSLV